ncbi:DUF4178 domain-containing protein [Micromonospora sp. CPCC 206060]|uniref:DUF4178 domain-containing protein n=1 Tax=Micromonospora sp. CPCC 206060 TaxID=3122406 RepID=UPI002FF2CDC2
MDGAMAYLVATVGCLAGVAGVVVAVLALRRSGAAGSRRPRDPFRLVDDDADALRGDPRKLRPGDIVEIRQTPYGVRGTLRIKEGAWVWYEHLLDDANGTKCWISVEEDPDLELVLWTAVPGSDLNPGAKKVTLDGQRYTSRESGQARFKGVGNTGLNPSGSMSYHDFRGPGGTRLSFESFEGGAWEVARGEVLHRAEVRIYPQADSTERL